MSGNQLAFVFITRLPQLAAVIGAIVVACRGQNGWGWLIFLAIMIDTSVKIRSE